MHKKFKPNNTKELKLLVDDESIDLNDIDKWDSVYENTDLFIGSLYLAKNSLYISSIGTLLS